MPRLTRHSTRNTVTVPGRCRCGKPTYAVVRRRAVCLDHWIDAYDRVFYDRSGR